MLAIFNIIWYTVTVLILSFFDHTVPAELTTAWFAAWTIELALLYGIKVKSKDAPSSEFKDIPDYIDEQPTQEPIVDNTSSMMKPLMCRTNPMFQIMMKKLWDKFFFTR